MSGIDAEYLLALYASGVFPMADEQSGRILLFSPDPRTVLPLDSFHVSHSLRKCFRSGRHETRINTAFESVICACALREETWISEEIIHSYVRLHELGHAHSVETWIDDKLAGGLYGVSMGGAFFGESMFHRIRDSSKLALVALVHRMRQRGMILLDVQFTTPHLMRFGSVEIPRREYLRRLDTALHLDVSFYP